MGVFASHKLPKQNHSTVVLRFSRVMTKFVRDHYRNKDNLRSKGRLFLRKLAHSLAWEQEAAVQVHLLEEVEVAEVVVPLLTIQQLLVVEVGVEVAVVHRSDDWSHHLTMPAAKILDYVTMRKE